MKLKGLEVACLGKTTDGDAALSLTVTSVLHGTLP